MIRSWWLAAWHLFYVDSDLDEDTEAQEEKILEGHGRVTRYLDDLYVIREPAQIVKDELGSSLCDQLNRNLYVLSVVAAIFLPLTLLTGLSGINVAGIPEVDHEVFFDRGGCHTDRIL